MPSTLTLLALLAAVVCAALLFYSGPHRERSGQLPGLTYAAKRDSRDLPIVLVVTSVADGSAAASADITAGDVIDRIDGRPIASRTAIGKAIRHDGANGIDVRVRHAGRWRYKHLPASGL